MINIFMNCLCKYSLFIQYCVIMYFDVHVTLDQISEKHYNQFFKIRFIRNNIISLHFISCSTILSSNPEINIISELFTG